MYFYKVAITSVSLLNIESVTMNVNGACWSEFIRAHPASVL